MAGCLGDDASDWSIDRTLAPASVVQYQGPGCACCDAYASYLADHIAGGIDTEVVDDLDGVKATYGIDDEMRSCHTVLVDGYVVEGHVPVETIAVLLDDAPDIAGIALPGMPAGSPGMPGRKDRTWTVYALHEDGDTTVFDRL